MDSKIPTAAELYDISRKSELANLIKFMKDDAKKSNVCTRAIIIFKENMDILEKNGFELHKEQRVDILPKKEHYPCLYTITWYPMNPTAPEHPFNTADDCMDPCK